MIDGSDDELVRICKTHTILSDQSKDINQLHISTDDILSSTVSSLIDKSMFNQRENTFSVILGNLLCTKVSAINCGVSARMTNFQIFLSFCDQISHRMVVGFRNRKRRHQEYKCFRIRLQKAYDDSYRCHLNDH